MSRPTPRRVSVAACLLLAAFVVQAAIAARRDSVTIDEFAHLPLGLYTLRTRSFALDPMNPPLTRLIATLPLLLDPPAFDPQPGMREWRMGYDFMLRNRDTYHSLFVRARMMMILLATLVGILVWRWASELYGTRAGLVALAVFAFEPNMLAYGHLVTPDIGGTLGCIATAYATWRMLARGTVRSAAVVGISLGLAMLLKLSAVAVVAALVLSVGARAVERAGRSGAGPAHWVLLLVIAGGIALATLDAGYAFEGVWAPLASATLDPRGTLAAVRDALPWLRLPVPLPVINGVDMALNLGRQEEPTFFLAGELSRTGWWYYHLAAFAVKTPLPLALLAVGAIVMWSTGRSPGVREYCVFLPVLLVFASNALFNSLQIGLRHVIPVYPLLAVGGSPWIVRALARWREGRWKRAGVVATALGLAWLLGSTLAVAPRYLQYFNELAGGPEGGHRILIDSNLDWGQDLIRLREYVERRRLDTVQLAYFGRVDPAVYGIRYSPLERGSSHGTAVVSASFLMGRPYYWIQGGSLHWVPARTYSWLQQYPPIDRVGSMFVFALP